MNASSIGLATILAATSIVGAGCDKKPEVQQDGQGSAPSGVCPLRGIHRRRGVAVDLVAVIPVVIPVVVPLAVPLVLLVRAARRRHRRLGVRRREAPCPTRVGTDGLNDPQNGVSPDGGGGEGIGLGTIGGLGHGVGSGNDVGIGVNKPAGGTSMKGTSKITAGKIDVAASEHALCDAFIGLHRCFNAAQKEAATLAGNALLTIVVAANGHVDSVTSSGTLGDAALSACVTPTLKALVLPKPEGGPATLEYGIDYTRSPGAGRVQMSETGITIKGALPPEVVKRIVRANFPRFRGCYERGKKTNPDLAGPVSVDFQIDMTGAVMATTLAAGGAVVDADLGKCVVGVFNTLSFPEPEQGAVKVHYGMVFETW